MVIYQTPILCFRELAKKFVVVVGGGWVCKPILVFSLGFDQAEQFVFSVFFVRDCYIETDEFMCISGTFIWNSGGVQYLHRVSWIYFENKILPDEILSHFK